MKQYFGTHARAVNKYMSVSTITDLGVIGEEERTALTNNNNNINKRVKNNGTVVCVLCGSNNAIFLCFT